MTSTNIVIWDREFNLDITYDCYSGEEILDSQKKAIEAFVLAKKEIELSLDKVKAYCLSVNREAIIDDKIENIFKYVIPKYLYVPRTTQKHIVAIMCNYRFDQEHGIAIVFENEKFTDIGIQDIIL